MLKVSISGIRGVWGESLTHEIILGYTKAFVSLLGTHKKIAIGRDTRQTGAIFSKMVIGILESYGYEILDLEIAPTPLVLYTVRHLNLDGGIVLTASHNPSEWNAFKFVKKGGVFFDHQNMEDLQNFYKKPQNLPYTYETLGKSQKYSDYFSAYFKELQSFFNMDLIKKSRFKIVADLVNGTASTFIPFLFKELNIDGSLLFEDPSKNFERPAEPKPENLFALCESVKEKKAHLGLGFDPDGDRLALVDDKGRAIGENWTLVLAYKNYLATKKGLSKNIAVNVSTSMLIDEVAKENHAKVIKTAVGEINVSQAIQQHSLEIGGEGNGGVIFPQINNCRDSIIALLFVLEYLAITQQNLSSLVDDVKKPFTLNKSFKLIAKSPIKNEALEKILLKCCKELSLIPESINKEDGIRMDFKDGWVHLRTSNTEPILRCMGEHYDQTLQQELAQSIQLKLNL